MIGVGVTMEPLVELHPAKNGAAITNVAKASRTPGRGTRNFAIVSLVTRLCIGTEGFRKGSVEPAEFKVRSDSRWWLAIKLKPFPDSMSISHRSVWRRRENADNTNNGTTFDV